MSRSLLEQLGQIDGSRNYKDSEMDASLAEVCGRAYLPGTLVVSSGNSTVTDNGNNFEGWELGSVLVVTGGAAAGTYTITAVDDADATVTPTPTATEASSPYNRHYRKNLEDDLNYVRNQLDLVIGEQNWYDAPSSTLSGLDGHQHVEADITDLDKYTQAEVDALVSGTNEFTELTDTISSYNEGRLLFESSAAVVDSADLVFDTVSGTLEVSGSVVATREDAPVDERVPYWNESEARFDTQGDTYFAISQADDTIDVGVDSVEALSITSSGISLQYGANVDEFSTDGTLAGDSDTAIPTEQAVKTYVDNIAGAQDEFLDLTDTISSYNENRILFESDSAVIDDADFTYNPTTDTFSTSNITATGNMGVSGTLDVDGAVDFDSTLDVEGAVTLQNNLTVNGTFGFDTGTTVNEFSTDGTLAGNSDDAVPTEAAVKTYIDTAVSGTDEFTELTDTPSDYSGDAGKLLRVNAGADAVEFEDDLVYDGSTLTIDGGFDLTGSADIQTNLSISGTLGFGGQTVDEIVTTITSPTDDQLPTAKAVDDLLFGNEGAIAWEVVDTPTDRIQPRQEYMGLPIYTPGSLTVGGDLTVTGSLVYTDVETLQVADNIIEINYGENGAGVVAGQAGFEIDRGSMSNYFLVFDEPTDTFRVGVSGTLQAVATREDSPVDTVVPWWNDTDKRFDTSGSAYIKVDTANDDIELAVASTVEATVDANGLSLKSGASVNEFSTDGTLADDSDDAVPTEKAVKLYVDTTVALYDEFIELTDTPAAFSTGDYLISTASGLEWTSTIDHNSDTASKDGGGGGEWNHLSADEYGQISAADSTHFDFGGGTALQVNGTFELASGTTVNEIVSSAGSLSGASTDDQLATAKLIYDEIQDIVTASGSVTHNLLSGLQGGNGSDEFYHLTYADYLTVGHSHPYDATGTAAAAVSSHESTWNHNNFLTSETSHADVVVDGDFTSQGIMLRGGSAGSYSIATSSSGINEVVTTVVSGSTDAQLPTAKAVWDLTEAAASAVHTHYDVDGTYVSDTSWTYGSGFSVLPDNLCVFVNGLKQRIGATYDCTVAASGAITITFLYEVASDNWVNLTYTATD